MAALPGRAASVTSAAAPPRARGRPRCRERGIGSCLLRPRRHISARGPGPAAPTSKKPVAPFTGCNRFSLVPCSICGLGLRNGRSHTIPHSLPTTGDDDHAHWAAKPAAGKAHAGHALTARSKVATMKSRCVIRIFGKLRTIFLRGDRASDLRPRSPLPLCPGTGARRAHPASCQPLGYHPSFESRTHDHDYV